MAYTRKGPFTNWNETGVPPPGVIPVKADFLNGVEDELISLGEAAATTSDAAVADIVSNPLSDTTTVLDGYYAAISRTGTPAVGQRELTFSVMDFGAIGDGVADDTVAIQSAIDFAAAQGSGNALGAEVFFPHGLYVTTAPLVLKDGVLLRGVSQRGCAIENNTSDLFAWTTATVNYAGIRDLFLLSGPAGGHVFNLTLGGGLTLSQMSGVYILVQGTGSSVWRQRDSGNTIDTLFQNCEFSRPAASTVPAWDVITTQPCFNSVTWQRVRAHGHGTTAAPFFRIENNSGATSNTHLTFDGVTGEQNAGGFMHFYACNGIRIVNCPDWDNPGTYMDDLFKFASSGGRGTWNVTMEDSFKMSGDMAVGKYDIQAGDQANRNIYIVNPDASDSRPASVDGATDHVTGYVTVIGSNRSDGARHFIGGRVVFEYGITLGRDTALPPADNDHRGQVIILNSDTGDEVYVCRHLGTGNGFEWTRIV